MAQLTIRNLWKHKCQCFQSEGVPYTRARVALERAVTCPEGFFLSLLHAWSAAKVGSALVSSSAGLVNWEKLNLVWMLSM